MQKTRTVAASTPAVLDDSACGFAGDSLGIIKCANGEERLGVTGTVNDDDPGGGQVTGTAIWNISADETDLIDYDTSFKRDAQDALYAPDAFRSSDHDPVIVGLRLLTKDDCKRGGWKALGALEAFNFRNQGQCVSHFAAGSRRR